MLLKCSMGFDLCSYCVQKGRRLLEGHILSAECTAPQTAKILPVEARYTRKTCETSLADKITYEGMVSMATHLAPPALLVKALLSLGIPDGVQGMHEGICPLLARLPHLDGTLLLQGLLLPLGEVDHLALEGQLSLNTDSRPDEGNMHCSCQAAELDNWICTCLIQDLLLWRYSASKYPLLSAIIMLQ